MAKGLARDLNDAVVRRLAGEGPYRRGYDFCKHGYVDLDASDGATIAGQVRGEQTHSARITSADGILDYACDCSPNAVFCEHCAAVALAWLQQSGKAKSRGKAKTRVTLNDAAAMLEEEDRETLVQMILNWARDDEAVRDRLVQYAARKTGPEAAVIAARRAFVKAVRIRSWFLDGRQHKQWAQAAGEAVTLFRQLLTDGQPAAVMELCEAALVELATAVEKILDPSEIVPPLSEALHQLHFEACEQAKPDPVALARRLFELEMKSTDLELFYDAACRYALLLGDSGLNEYRRLAQAEWARPATGTGRDESERQERLQSIRLSLARASGDLNELVAVISENLSSADDYLDLAHECHHAGRHDLALDFAEKGLRQHPESPHLREVAIALYRESGRHDDVMRLAWDQFASERSAIAYHTFKRCGSGRNDWPQWRERALSLVRRPAGEKPSHTDWPHRNDNSTLVEILVEEGEVDAALQAAQTGGCSYLHWLKIAQGCERDRPGDAADAYLRCAQEDLATRYRDCFDNAVEMLAKAAAAMHRAGRTPEFLDILRKIRARHRNLDFQHLLEKNRNRIFLA